MTSTSPAAQASATHQHWRLEDIPWQDIDRKALANQELLFYLVASASFIETATDTYARNLIAYYAGNQEATTWLEKYWQHEELQHGQALKRYAQTAWPDFDWDRVYQAFFAEFSATCTIEALEPSHGLEMVSRCIVEMGTSSYYTALSRLSSEPVLSQLTRLIREDEVHHYKYFYRYFLHYRADDHLSRLRILKAIVRRLRMIDGDDSSIALKHVYLFRHPDANFDERLYRSLQAQARHMLGPQFPHAMSAKMTLKPLDLSPWVQKTALPIIVFLSRCLLWGEGGRLVKSHLHFYIVCYLWAQRYSLTQWRRFAP